MCQKAKAFYSNFSDKTSPLNKHAEHFNADTQVKYIVTEW